MKKFLSIVGCLVLYFVVLSASGLGEDMATTQSMQLAAIEYILLPFVGIPLIINSLFTRQANKDAYQRLLASLKEDGFTIQHQCVVGKNGFYVDDTTKRLFFVKDVGSEYKGWLVNFDNLLGLDFKRDSQVLVTTRHHKSLGGAIAGGLLLGGPGLLLGGMPNKSTGVQKEQITKITLEVVLNHEGCPIYRMEFPSSLPEFEKHAEKAGIMLELIMMRVDIPNIDEPSLFSDMARSKRLLAIRQMEAKEIV